MLDEDIRIASDTPSKELRGHSDMGESVAKEFRRHKENGNIFAANRLGEELARPLLENREDLFGPLQKQAERLNQMRFLYGFAVRGAIYEGIQVSILADTALHSFLETVEDADTGLYATLTDSVSDTIYRLCLSEMPQAHGVQCVGAVFAKMCQEQNGGELKLEEEGNALYEKFLAFAVGKIQKISLKP